MTTSWIIAVGGPGDADWRILGSAHTEHDARAFIAKYNADPSTEQKANDDPWPTHILGPDTQPVEQALVLTCWLSETTIAEAETEEALVSRWAFDPPAPKLAWYHRRHPHAPVYHLLVGGSDHTRVRRTYDRKRFELNANPALLTVEGHG